MPSAIRVIDQAAEIVVDASGFSGNLGVGDTDVQTALATVDGLTIVSAPAGNSGNVQFNSSGAFGGSDNLFWDSGNSRLGIGTATPAQVLDVADEVILGDSGAVSGVVTISLRGVNPMIAPNTSDASDTEGVWIAGGGGSSRNRGARIAAYGNEHSSLPGSGGFHLGNIAAAHFAIFDGLSGTNNTLLRVQNNTLVGINETSPGAQLQVTSSAAAVKGVIIKGAASQSANLQEFQDSDGAVLAYIDGVGLALFARVRQAAIWHGYGGFEGEGESVACGVGDWNHITNAGSDLWNLDEADGISISSDVFTIVNSGDYAGSLSLSISAINGKDFHVRVYNKTQISVEGRPIGISTTSTGNEMNVSVPIYIEATAGDEIQFEIQSADGTDPVVDDAIFILSYLHD